MKNLLMSAAFILTAIMTQDAYSFCVKNDGECAAYCPGGHYTISNRGACIGVNCDCGGIDEHRR